MLTLNLGVIDVNYVEGDGLSSQRKRIAKARQGKQRIRKGNGGLTPNESTGDVADILENKYALFTVFFELCEEEIMGYLADALEGTIDDLLSGAPLSNNPYGAATERIVLRFRKFIENEEMDETGTPGVPTKAALQGVNHRLNIKHGARRPSFRDTGLMEASFAAWMSGQ